MSDEIVKFDLMVKEIKLLRPGRFQIRTAHLEGDMPRTLFFESDVAEGRECVLRVGEILTVTVERRRAKTNYTLHVRCSGNPAHGYDVEPASVVGGHALYSSVADHCKECEAPITSIASASQQPLTAMEGQENPQPPFEPGIGRDQD